MPNYTILSHRWGAERGVTVYKYFWVDTCCIDKSSSAELSEAINSMFCWYQKAARYYVYLLDESAFRASEWFIRGWALQELLAPASVAFFSQEREQLEYVLSQFDMDKRLLWASRRITRGENKVYSQFGIFDVQMPLLYGEGEVKVF
ncbi:hypothetical protein B0O99DRAFT_649524 [Bisporella sp. PMI_857]|nr:hypothetical protein B0O99DRAFT_649524 [Bisporella sp. PMI_857]